MGTLLAILVTVFIVALLTQLLLPFPLDAILVVLIRTETHYFFVILAAILGLLLGATLDFLVGRYGAERWHLWKLKKKHKNYAKAANFYHKVGDFALLFAFVPVIGKYFPLISGVLETSSLRFFSFYLLGKVAYYGVIAATVRNVF